MSAVNRIELRRYVRRIADRWQLEAAYLCPAELIAKPGLADVADGLPSLSAEDSVLARDGERANDFVVVLVSESFDAVPWLERVHIAGALWDAQEMGATAEIHCYTAIELVRKQRGVPSVHAAVEHGVDLLAALQE